MLKKLESPNKIRRAIYEDSILVAEGPFLMGSEFKDSEHPIHLVYTKEYHMSKHLVTNKIFADFLNIFRVDNEAGDTYCFLDVYNKMCRIKKANGTYVVQKGFENHPVTLVNWAGANIFCRALGGELPSEARWEKAARGGFELKKYPWGDEEPESDMANFAEVNGMTTAVGSYPPNKYGLADMAGNVWEWMSDWYSSVYYKKSKDFEPAGPKTGVDKSIRGGGWAYPKESLRCSKRGKCWSRIGGTNIGFRVVNCASEKQFILSENRISNLFKQKVPL
ncbi:MAG: SUMF1/EgtB/PvdO family nonheme iron enzyme [Candidatus Micrarchaeota archaeon]